MTDYDRAFWEERWAQALHIAGAVEEWVQRLASGVADDRPRASANSGVDAVIRAQRRS